MDIEVRIEIPKDSQVKYEWDKDRQVIVVDRILRDGFTYPWNYGSISETLDWDGDELDVVIFSKMSFVPGSLVRVRLLGALKMVDQGEQDTKLIAVHSDDYRLERFRSLEDLPVYFRKSVTDFFSNYKNWKGEGATKVSGFEKIRFAKEELKICQQLYKDYSELDKEEFVKLMKQKFPERYEV